MMKRYLGQIIKEHLGIRGFFLQRKLLKGGDIGRFTRLSARLCSSPLHAKGKDLAVTLRDQFDQRMYVRFFP